MSVDTAKDASRAAFEAHLLAWTGRDAAYHDLHATTGLGFAWSCWQAGMMAERDRSAQVCKALSIAAGRCPGTSLEGDTGYECRAAILNATRP